MKTEAVSDPGGGLCDWLRWGRAELAFLPEREAHQECEQILGALLEVSRTDLYLSNKPDPQAFPKFFEGVRARKKRRPLAYISGKAHFWEDEFEVEDGVFIPRPETERLIEAFLETSRFSKGDTFRLLDLGAGSGNIAVTLAKLFPRSYGVALDLSDKSLAVTLRNARRLGVEGRLEFVRGDGLLAFGKEAFDTIFSNPPYVASRDWQMLEPEVRQEPRLALDGGEDGLDFYRKILRELSCLKRGGSLWVEIGWGEASRVRSLFERVSFRQTLVFKDLNQIDRVVAGIDFGSRG